MRDRRIVASMDLDPCEKVAELVGKVGGGRSWAHENVCRGETLRECLLDVLRNQ